MKKENLFILLLVVVAITSPIVSALVLDYLADQSGYCRVDFLMDDACRAATEKAVSEGYGATGQGGGGFAITMEEFPECFDVVCNQ